jgi:hypothetical protein
MTDRPKPEIEWIQICINCWGGTDGHKANAELAGVCQALSDKDAEIERLRNVMRNPPRATVITPDQRIVDWDALAEAAEVQP